jgi:hypothetical protein
MRLRSVLWSSSPQKIKWWSWWVTLPHNLACRASALLVCHNPFEICDFGFSNHRLASRCGAAPHKLNFGDSAARLVRGLPKSAIRNRKSQIEWCGCRELHPADGRPQGPWRGDILLLNHNREIKRAGRVIARPARAISIKNKHLLAIYSTPTRGFTAAVSVFRGTVYRHTNPVASRSSPALNSISHLMTSSRRLVSIAHSYSNLSISRSFTYSYAWKTKNPASIR